MVQANHLQVRVLLEPGVPHTSSAKHVTALEKLRTGNQPSPHQITTTDECQPV